MLLGIGRLWFPLTVVLLTAAAGASDAAERVDFDKQIAPLLVRRCIGCHNPSELKGRLDLTRRGGTLHGGDTGAAIVPGEPDGSVLLERISEGSMPPDDAGKPLSPAEVALVRKWIEQDAPWPESRVLSPFELTTEHRAGRDWWSLQPVKRPPLPDVQNASWCRGPIDRFVLRRLEEIGLSPAEPADRISWLRRAKFDLLGLPPTPQEIDAFLADDSPEAYERLLDRLLGSPHYGERWGRHWLDAVGYTESDGFENDKFRPHAWRYRDWVIDSLNADKPYARFVTEQLAGDALPRPTRESIAATGFLVAGPWDEIQNVGASKSEMRRAHEEQIADLIGMVSQTFLGMTVACARCHDHKFDPVPQTDFYRIKAVFDGVDHSRGRTVGNRPLLNVAELAAREEKLAPLEAKRKEIEERLAELERALPGDAVAEKFEEKTLTEGRFGAALDARRTYARTTSKPAYHNLPLTVECWVQLHSNSKFNVFVANNLKTSGEHWELYSYRGKGDFSVYLPGYAPAEIRSDTVITDGQWHYVAMQIEGDKVRLFVDGELVKQQTVKREKPAGDLKDLVFGGYPAKGIGCDGLVDEVRISAALVDATDVPTSPLVRREHTIGLWRFDEAQDNRFVDVSHDSSSAEQERVVRQRAELNRSLAEMKKKIAALEPPLAYIGFRDQPPATHVLLRGDIKSPGELVTAGALSTVNVPSPDFGLDESSPEGKRRLAFAAWVSDPANPFTARVLVNRVWQHHFGQGLVKTPSDFGFNGGLPSHPELLDWLADDFLRSGGSIKHLHRRIMLSAAYRQSSRFAERAARIDADNRLLWRYTPRRLEGEIARDAMLAVSGEINRRIGGPSFQPFTVTVFNTHFYHLFDDGRPDFNRRTIYRAGVITGRDPLLDSLDCPAPAVSTPARRTTVTPQQALSLMNDSFVMRQAQRFAERVRREVGDEGGVDAQIGRAWRIAVSRRPSEDELQSARRLVEKHDLATACWVLLNSTEFLYAP
jgi:hypothetical protein